MKTAGSILCATAVCFCTVPVMGWSPAGAIETSTTEVALASADIEARLLAALPKDADVRIMLRDGDGLIHRLKAIAGSPVVTDSQWWDQITSNPELSQARLMLLGVASVAKTDAWSAVGSVLGDRLAVGVNFDDETGEPHYVIASLSDNTEVRDRVMQQVLTFVTGSNELKSNQIVPIGDAFYKSTNDGMIVFSNDRAMIKKSTGRANATPDARLMATVAKQVPADATIWTQVSSSFIERAIESEGNFSAKANEPLQGFLFGDWLHAIDNSRDGLAWLAVDDDSIRLSTVIDSDMPMPETHSGLLSTLSDGPEIWSGSSIEGYAGQMVISRDWAELFSERESLLNVVGAGQAVDFTSTLTSLLGGLDVMDDVLPAINGPINLIVARQNFESLGFKPNPQLPAFAMITPLDMSMTKNLALRLRSGTLSALSVVSLEMANNNQKVYAIQMGKHRGVDIVWSAYPEGDGNEDAGMSMLGPRFNFAPCTAIVDDHFVITTSIDLMKDLIDLQQDKTPSLEVPSAASGELLIESTGLASILQDNKEALIADEMLKKNHSRAQATQNIDLMFTLLDMVQDLTITSTPSESGSVVATAELRFNDDLLQINEDD